MKVINSVNIICTTLFLTALCWFNNHASAQYKALKPGDVVPDVLFKEVTNYNKPTLKLSEFRGKYVILDFWNHGCLPCLEGFEKIDPLQKEFASNLQIIAVNAKGNKETLDLFKRLKNVHHPNIPFINADTALHQMFPHFGVPHHIWLDREGKLMYAADFLNMKRDSLSKLIAKGKLDVVQKNNPAIVETLLDNRFLSDLGMASYIYRRGDRKFSLFPNTSTRKGKYEMNTIANLYGFAFNDSTANRFTLLRPGRIILEVDHPEYFQVPRTLKGAALVEWKAKHIYVYQSIVPADSKVNLSKMMLEDLERYFNCYGTIEKRKIKTIALVRTSQIDKLKTIGGETKNTLVATNAASAMESNTVRKLSNTDYSMLSGKIQGWVEYDLKLPFKDLTTYTGKVDFIIDGQVLDHLTLASLKDELKKYDLDLEERELETDVLVLRTRE